MIQRIESFLINFSRRTGGIVILFGKALFFVFKRPWRINRIVDQIYLDGLKSIPVIFLMAIFTGGVLTLQSFFALQRLGVEIFTGALVGVSLCKELIPVLGGLMLAGRVSASYSAELGSMVVTEQVDALYTFGINPIQYLVTPRLVAMAMMAPLLTLFGDFISVMGGKAVAVIVCYQNPNLFDSQLFYSLDMWDIVSGLIKSVFFGITIAVIGSYFGLNTEGGAKGVGRATTEAVVVSAVIILVSDFFWSKILPFTLQ